MAGIHAFFHSTGVTVARNVAIVLAVFFWLALAYWVHKDARRRIRDRFLRFLANVLGLVPPFIGPVVYLLFRPAETIADVRSRDIELRALEHRLAHVRPACPVCTSPIEPDYLALRAADLGELPDYPAAGTVGRILVAAKVGTTRLIDNLPLEF